MSFVLLDGSKFQQTAFTHVADLTQAEIITSKAPKEIIKKCSCKQELRRFHHDLHNDFKSIHRLYCTS